MNDLITENEFDNLANETQINYWYCQRCGMFHKRFSKVDCTMVYKYVIEVEAMYPLITEMISSLEAAINCGNMIVEQIQLVNGKGKYSIKSHVRHT